MICLIEILFSMCSELHMLDRELIFGMPSCLIEILFSIQFRTKMIVSEKYYWPCRDIIYLVL